MKTTTIRIDERTKAEATEVFDLLGLNFSQAINMFLHQVVLNKGIPFPLHIPNAETAKALQEKDSEEVYNDVNEMLSDLLNDDYETNKNKKEIQKRHKENSKKQSRGHKRTSAYCSTSSKGRQNTRKVCGSCA